MPAIIEPFLECATVGKPRHHQPLFWRHGITIRRAACGPVKPIPPILINLDGSEAMVSGFLAIERKSAAKAAIFRQNRRPGPGMELIRAAPM
jgi:hypothetical protein